MNIKYVLYLAISVLGLVTFLGLVGADFPHSFWMTTRTVISGSAALVIFDLSQKRPDNDHSYLIPAFILIIVLYNPIWPTYLYVQWKWALCNAYTLATFYYAMQKIKVGNLKFDTSPNGDNSSFVKYFETWCFVVLIVLGMIIFSGNSDDGLYCVRLKHGMECY